MKSGRSKRRTRYRLTIEQLQLILENGGFPFHSNPPIAITHDPVRDIINIIYDDGEFIAEAEEPQPKMIGIEIIRSHGNIS